MNHGRKFNTSLQIYTLNYATSVHHRMTAQLVDAQQIFSYFLHPGPADNELVRSLFFITESSLTTDSK